MDKDNALGIDFESKKVFRGKEPLMDLDELLFLIGSAVKYVESFPNGFGEDFVNELREIVGMGFTNEQFETIKTMMRRENDQ